MKKLILPLCIASLALSLTGCLGGMNTQGNAAQSNIGSIVSGVAGAVANTGTLEDLLSGFLSKATLNESSLYGTWKYTGVDIVFETDNFLAKAGGAVAANSLEEKLDAQLAKIGMKEGNCTFVFNQNKTFQAVLNGKTIQGTYVYNPSTRSITLTAALGLFNQTATVGSTTSGISLLFDADKLLSLVSAGSSLLGGSNSTLSSLTSLVNNYNGMKIGLGMSK